MPLILEPDAPQRLSSSTPLWDCLDKQTFMGALPEKGAGLSLAAPHRLFALERVRRRAGGTVLGAGWRARACGWQALLLDGEKPLAIVALSRRLRGFRPGTAITGPAVLALARGLNAADEVAGRGRAEVRAVVVPGLKLDLLWVRRRGAGDGDRLLPLTPLSPRLPALQAQPLREALEGLNELLGPRG